jgi:spermidine synthase
MQQLHRENGDENQNSLPPFCRSHISLSIFMVSVLVLFLEMMLIRWIGTEVRIFAYLQNTILVVCLLGLGLGCFSCRKPISMTAAIAPLLILVGLFAIPDVRHALGSISQMLSVTEGLLIWHQHTVASKAELLFRLGAGLALTYALMLLVWHMFVPIGRLLGRLLDDHPKVIQAYSINVGGSLVGILLFVLVSMYAQPPITWVALCALMFCLFVSGVKKTRHLQYAMLAVMTAASWPAGSEPGALETHWSPYQKLVISEPDDPQFGKYLVNVNNVGFQGINDLRPEHVAEHPEIFAPEMSGYSRYDIPPILHPDPKTMLCVGAGTGNDAAGGLRNGVEHITAVEIDPVVIDLGQRYHPEAPYGSERVDVINDDARSFFSNCKRQFDVISFGLLDSHTQTALTNARLDHYVYTLESIRQARSLLSEDGIMVLSFAAERLFISDRMATLLRDVFGEEPIRFNVPPSSYGWAGIMFVAGNLDGARSQIDAHPRLASLIDQWNEHHFVPLTYSTAVTTDDWPYIYLQRPMIPTLFFLLAIMLVLIHRHGRHLAGVGSLVSSWGRTQWHFFFLGAAFMLLEVQNISKASVVFGSTWWVNAVIISGVLAMVLLANAITMKWPTLPLRFVYAALLMSCISLYLIDISRFASFSFIAKAIIVGALTTIPMLFSGIVFIRSFAAIESKADALGANLLGSLVGGLLQSVTFLVGIKALLLIVAGLYTLSLLTRPKRSSAALPVSPDRTMELESTLDSSF